MFELFPGHYRWSYNTLLALAAGGQVGDIDLIARNLQEDCGNDSLWHDEWSRLARILERRAQVALDAGGAESASENLFLASLYHTISEHFVPPADPRRSESYAHVLSTFEQARVLSSQAIERVSIPFERAEMPAYFIPNRTARGRSPAVIFLCGLDTTKELSALRVRQHFANRGMHCLAVDTPGVGEALRRHSLVTRFDYEKPVATVIDYLQSRADVDPSRIAIVGSSLGGYYVARAAAFEPRLHAVVAWGVIHDYHAVWKRRMTQGGAIAAPSFQLMFITGTQSMDEAMKHVAEFKVAPIGARISCPFLIVHGAQDQQVTMSDAHAMHDAIGSSDKELRIFGGEDAGAQHCQFDNHLPALQYVGDWLARKLGLTPAPCSASHRPAAAAPL